MVQQHCEKSKFKDFRFVVLCVTKKDSRVCVHAHLRACGFVGETAYVRVFLVVSL
jgi:hypothetical protein